MSDEYRDRYIIVALLKTPLGTIQTMQDTTVVPSERTSSSDRTKDLPNTYSRSTAETTMNHIGQNVPVIYLHLEGTS